MKRQIDRIRSGCKLFGLIGLLQAAPCLSGQGTVQEELLACPAKTGGIYYTYQPPLRPSSPAPAGYRPVYISHYGRHGSRWLLRDSDYTVAAGILRDAARDGKLTPLGNSVRQRMERIVADAAGREGELAPAGTRQHRDIAGRMFRGYPEIFAGDARVECRSTRVVRCVMSMAAFGERLKELNPRLQLTRDAGKRYTYLNYTAPEAARFYAEPGWNAGYRAFRKKRIDPGRFTASLFTDPAYLQKKIDPAGLMEKIFLIASNLQNLELNVSLDDIFVPEERYRLWQCINYDYYVRRGTSPVNRGLAVANARELAERIAADADRALAGTGPAADLRFGHDGGLMSLLGRLQVSGCCAVEADPERAGERWADFKIAPMAANLQLVFYRHDGTGDVLVKILHNECEAAIPVPTDRAPYYPWPAVRRFLLEGPVPEP